MLYSPLTWYAAIGRLKACRAAWTTSKYGRAGPGMAESHLLQTGQRLIVHDLAVFHDAAMAVRRVLIDADIGDHHQVGNRVFHRAHRARHDAVRRPRLAAELVLARGDAEQQDGRHAQGVDLP